MVDRHTLREEASVPSGSTKAESFRPKVRPPMALLIAVDDGSTDSGEMWRLRGDRHVIGRRKGDTVISHDAGVSAEHAAVTRELRNGEYVWHLIDFESTNGTFLRVHKGALADRCQLLLGSRRYVFHVERGAAGDAPESAGERDEMPPTQLYLGPAPPGESGNCLVECGPDGVGQVFSIKGHTTWIGSAADRCQIVLAGDAQLCPRHACIRLDSRERWVIQDANSVNGVWIRVDRVRLISDSEFQVGEQRFLFKFLPAREAK